jgi:CBS domain-containing protein
MPPACGQVLPAKIRELYHRDVLTGYPDETLAAVAGRMQQEAVGSLAVIEEGRLVGIVTERDLVRAASDGAGPQT